MTQLSLLEYQPPRFHGSTFDPGLDEARLLSQQERVTRLMSDGVFRTLRQIHEVLGHPEASISARLRSARMKEHGGWLVDRERVPGARGLFRYRLRKPSGGTA